jgi:hypothetical protein
MEQLSREKCTSLAACAMSVRGVLHKGEEKWGERKASHQGRREAPLGIIDLANAHYIGDILCLVLQVF